MKTKLFRKFFMYYVQERVRDFFWGENYLPREKKGHKKFVFLVINLLIFCKLKKIPFSGAVSQ